jgi:hypothetical protein
MVDNNFIDIVSDDDEALGWGLGIAWKHAPGGKATHSEVIRLRKVTEYWPTGAQGSITTHHSVRLVEDEKGIPTLIFLWHAEGNAQELLYPVYAKSAVELAKGWLKNVNYGNEPDHDGDNERGWRIFTEAWGHVAGRHYAIIGIQPAWAMYGK